MLNSIDVGQTPSGEPCAQLGQTARFDYCARLECGTYIAALIANYGLPPMGSYRHATRKAYPFGNCFEVQLCYDPINVEHLEYADLTERGLTTWAPLYAPVVYDQNGAPTIVYLTTHDVVVNAIFALQNTSCQILTAQRDTLIAVYPRAARDAGVFDRTTKTETVVRRASSPTGAAFNMPAEVPEIRAWSSTSSAPATPTRRYACSTSTSSSNTPTRSVRGTSSIASIHSSNTTRTARTASEHPSQAREGRPRQRRNRTRSLRYSPRGMRVMPPAVVTRERTGHHHPASPRSQAFYHMTDDAPDPTKAHRSPRAPAMDASQQPFLA